MKPISTVTHTVTYTVTRSAGLALLALGAVLLLCLLLGLPATRTQAQPGTPSVSLLHDQDVIGVQWSAEGDRILTWTPTAIVVWDASTAERLTTIESPSQGADFALVEWRSSSERILTSTAANMITVYDSQNGAVVASIADEIFLDWDAAGQTILTQGPDFTTVRILGAELFTVETTALVARLAPDGQHAIIGRTLLNTQDGTQTTLDAPDPLLAAPLVAADWSPDSQALLVASNIGDVVLFDVSSASLQSVIATGPTGLDTFSVQFVAGGELIVQQSGPSFLEVTDRDGNTLRTIEREGPIISIDWYGDRVAVANQNATQDANQLVVVDAQMGEIATYTYPPAFLGASWATGGAFLMARSFDNSVVLFNPQTGAGVYDLQFDSLPGIIWHPTDLVFAARVGSSVTLYDLAPFAVEFE